MRGRGKSGEDADQRHARGGGDMLAGGIVAYIQLRTGDDRGKSGEGPVPEGRLHTRSLHRVFDPPSLFSARPLIHIQRHAA